MIKFKIEDKEYEIPEIMNIENFVKIYRIKDLFSDTYFAARLVSIVSNAPIEDLLESDYQELEYLAAHILQMIPTDNPKFVDRFEIDGVHYGFFPDWKDLSFAEFVDLDTISTKKYEEILDLMHILAAIMYRPIISQKSEHDFKIEKYDVDKMKDRAELFKKKLEARVILGAQFFFINFERRFSSYTQLSSIPKLTIWTKIKLLWMMRKLIWQTIFKKRLDGSLLSTELLETILRSTKLSIKKK
jgi:hypothetical protein